VLPPDQFPQFASSKGAAKFNFEGSPFAPIEGTKFAGALHRDASYTRLTRTIDLSGVTAAQAPKLQFQLSINTEPSYDNVIVEAHTPGQDNWTTLPDANGGSQTSPPAECTANGFLLQLHPFLRHYLGGANCTAAGTSGSWNSFTGSTQGWKQVAIDLSAYAGQQVEVSIAYVTDPGGGGVGAFVDDTKLTTAAGTVWADGFEGATSSWSVTGPPEGSPPNAANFEIGLTPPEFFAGTSTTDSLLLGFGIEQVANPADRAKLVKQALGGLGVRP